MDGWAVVGSGRGSGTKRHRYLETLFALVVQSKAVPPKYAVSLASTSSSWVPLTHIIRRIRISLN